MMDTIGTLASVAVGLAIGGGAIRLHRFDQRRLRMLSPAACDTHTEIPDPLREKFADLERDVRARERRELQARCPHRSTIDVTVIGSPRFRLCEDCGAEIHGID